MSIKQGSQVVRSPVATRSIVGSIPTPASTLSQGRATVARRAHNAKVAGSTPAPAKEVIREFLRKQGAKGGRKSAQHPRRNSLNRDAALARWRKELPAPKKL